MAPIGPATQCVVQVRVQHSFGTGYLVAAGLVLTAAHVVTTPEGDVYESISVNLPGCSPVSGTIVWWRKDVRVDAALIRLSLQQDEYISLPVRYGRFVTSQPNQHVEAIGFPRLQKVESARDQEHLAGLLSPATGAVSGRYEIISTAPRPAASSGDRASPWAGMSGAAAFSAGLLVGVVRSDRQAQHGARLTATPIAELFADEHFRRIIVDATGLTPYCEPVELVDILESPYSDHNLRSIAALLRADMEVVPFHGRTAEIDRLERWCTGPATLAVHILVGPGGEGKTRLARQLSGQLSSCGWTTGFLSPDPGDERFAILARIRTPLLIVVDQAENHPHRVRALLRSVRGASGPVRILLLARERGLWAEGLEEPDDQLRDLLADAPVLQLDSIASSAVDWEQCFLRAVQGLAAALPMVPGHETIDWSAAAAGVVVPPESTHLRQSSVLGIHMTALTLLLQHATPVAALRGEPVERTLLRHEESYWTRTARSFGLNRLDRTTLRSVIAALPLVTVADRSQATQLIDALGLTDADRGRLVVRWLRELYPRYESRYIGHVRPDRLAEFLLVEACADESDLLTRIVTGVADFADDQEPGYHQMIALREAVRAARSHEHYSGRPAQPLLRQLEQTAGDPVLSNETLSWTLSNVMTLPEAEQRQQVELHADGGFTINGLLDAPAAALFVAGYRRNAVPLRAGDKRQQGFEYSIQSHALTLLGRATEACQISELAAECFRSAPDCRGELAHELHRQAELLIRQGRNADAIDRWRDEVRVLTALDDCERLPTTLDLLISELCRTDQVSTALPFAQQETELLQRLDTGSDPTWQRAHIRSLLRHGQILRHEGAFTAALSSCAQAEDIIARLGHPASLSGEEACLTELRAEMLSKQGNSAASVAAWLAAASLWNARDEPFDKGPAPVVREVQCLNNAAVGREALGDHGEAATLTSRAVELALSERGEPVLRQRLELYEQVHATHIGYLVHAGQVAEALREAQRLWHRPKRSTSPLPPHFANSLRAVGLQLATEKRPAEAVEATRIAVAALHALDWSGSEPELSWLLAGTLTDHSANLLETGDVTEAAETAAHAAAVWRRVCAQHPEHRINLFGALANQAEALRAGQRYAESVRIFGEAADILREFAGHRRELARMLDGQAYCEFAQGDNQAAARTRAEQIDVYARLWQSDPSIARDLAKAEAELAVALNLLDRVPEALAAAGHAAQLFQDLHGNDPGPDWQYFARALMVYGTAQLKSGAAVAAVAPLARAMAVALQQGDMDLAAGCRSGVDLARTMDPAGVDAEWDRLMSGR
ncbi:serine protease [Nocardia abscessus]|uniref:S1 family peptidase n=1 Tax=Nocardia abscessus TaxID=120957 RepID=UPI00313C4B6A